MKTFRRLFPTTLLTLILGFPLAWLAFSQQTSKTESVIDVDAYQELMAYEVMDFHDLEAFIRNERSFYEIITPPAEDFVLRQPVYPVIPFSWEQFKGMPELFGDRYHYEYSVPVYRLRAVEDRETRQLHFYGNDKERLFSINPPFDYDPFEWLKSRYPGLYSGRYAFSEVQAYEAMYDPARVELIVTLIPTEYVEPYLYAQAKILEYQMSLMEDDGDGGFMMMSMGTESNIVITSVSKTTNGLLRLEIGYPEEFEDRLEVYRATDLIDRDWELVSGPLDTTGTTSVVWTDAQLGAQTVGFYAVGNYDQDSDSDGFNDAFEIFVLGTDPQDPDSHGVHFTGEILYGGPESAPVHVVAVTEMESWAKTWRTIIPAPQSYTNLAANQQDYWFKAFMDVSGNGQFDAWEPWGIYSTNSLYATSDVSGLDITLQDQPSIWGTIDYSGNATGDIHVLATTLPDWDTTYSTVITWLQGEASLTGDPVFVSFPADYSISGLPPGEYYVRAFIDEDYSGDFNQTKPGGQYAVDAIAVSNRVTGIDFSVGLDADADGIPDWWEIQYFGGPTNAVASADPDDDLLTNLEEFEIGTHPLNSDTDGDGMADGWEVAHGLNALDPFDAHEDADGDGWTNLEEYQAQTDPTDFSSTPSPTFYVDDVSGDDGNSGTFDQPFKTIQRGINAATNTGDWVFLMPGHYTGTNNVSLTYHGKAVKLRSLLNDADTVIIDGESAARVFSFTSGETTNALVQQVTVTGGFADFGAGIYCRTSSPTLRGLKLTHNFALTNGAAIYLIGSKARITDCIIEHNEALNQGAGIYSGNLAYLFQSSPPLLRSIGSSPVIEGTTFRHNVAASGAALVQTDALRVYSSVFLKANHHSGTGYVYRCTFRENISPSGATIQSGSTGHLYLENSVVTDNIGGGLSVSHAELHVLHSTITRNTRTQSQCYYSVVENGVTIIETNMVYGAGVASGHTPFGGESGSEGFTRIRNSIVWDNQPKEWQIYKPTGGGGPAVTVQSTLYDRHESAIPAACPVHISQSNVITNNPQLARSGYYLQANSPAIGAANTNWALAVDIQGEARPFGAGPDMGADEFVDTDSDGLPDWWENQHFGGPTNAVASADDDDDGLTNLEEYAWGTLPHLADTDGDGLSDGDEVNQHGTDPTNSDTDGDGIPDGWELDHGLDPLDPGDAGQDVDDDGLSYLQEYQLGTDPTLFDTDGDGLLDGHDITVDDSDSRYDDWANAGILYSDNGAWRTFKGELTIGTDPSKADTDGDGLPDGSEVANGLNPLSVDTDGDGLLDGADITVDSSDSLYDDWASGGIVYVDNGAMRTFKGESTLGTDPLNWDTDGDLLPDGWEAAYCLDPLDATGDHGTNGDPDEDGLTNLQELIYGTNPCNPDTDEDSVNDGDEVAQGSDPNNPSDGGQPPPAEEIMEVMFSVGDPSGSHSERWRMDIAGTGPEDYRTFGFLSPTFGEMGSNVFLLRRGNGYRITLVHIGTKPEQEDSDYDWQAQIEGQPGTIVLAGGQTHTDTNRYFVVNEEIIVDNLDGLLGVVNQGFGPVNHTIGKEARLYILNPRMIPDYDRNGVIDDDDHARAASFEPFYFWKNDNNDQSVDSGVDIPGQSPADAGDSQVDSVRDLVDFFPVWLDLKDTLALLGTTNYTFALNHALGGIGFVYTDLTPSNAGNYLTDVSTASDVANETVHIVTGFGNGKTLSQNFLSAIQNDGKGIILVEASFASTNALVLNVLDGQDNIIYSKDMPLSISGIEDMYRHINLRPSGGLATSTNEPPNYPDSLSNGKNVFFLHGFSVSGNEARGWHAQIFKRLFWSGSRAMFWGVTWEGDLGLINALHYQEDVANTFIVASNLSAAISGVSGEKIMLAHSLGNMVVSSAIEDYGLSADKYFMLNAAVATESYDPTAFNDVTSGNFMLHEDWTGYSNKTWCSTWFRLFSSPDDREKLTWKNRFPSILSDSYNFYSSGDEIFEVFAGTPSAFSGGLIPFHLERYAWQKQEMFKGRTVLGIPVLGGTGWAGWGFSGEYTMVQANSATEDNLRTNSVFRQAPSSMFSSNITVQTVNDINAQGVPALSYAAGVNEIDGAVFNYDANANKPNGWGRNDPTYGTRWKHSDLKNMAYLYTHDLFSQIINHGGLE